MILHRGPFAILAALVLAMPSAALADFNADPPNAIDQSPAFAGQTRAPVMPQAMRLIRTVLTEDLRHPWGMALLPDGGLLISERPGQLRLYRDGRLSPPIKGLPEVDARDQAGCWTWPSPPTLPRPGRSGSAFPSRAAMGKTARRSAPADCRRTKPRWRRCG